MLPCCTQPGRPLGRQVVRCALKRRRPRACAGGGARHGGTRAGAAHARRGSRGAAAGSLAAARRARALPARARRHARHPGRLPRAHRALARRRPAVRIRPGAFKPCSAGDLAWAKLSAPGRKAFGPALCSAINVHMRCAMRPFWRSADPRRTAEPARRGPRRQQRAALTLQAAWRGRTARLRYARFRAAVVALQSRWRGKRARRELRRRRAEVRAPPWRPCVGSRQGWRSGVWAWVWACLGALWSRGPSARAGRDITTGSSAPWLVLCPGSRTVCS